LLDAEQGISRSDYMIDTIELEQQTTIDHEQDYTIKLPNIERETIFLFNEAEPNAEIEVYNQKLKRRLEQLRNERPEDIRLTRQDKYSSSYIIPKSWIRINPSQILSEEEKQKRRDVLKQNTTAS